MDHAESSFRTAPLAPGDVLRLVRTYWRGIASIACLCVVVALVWIMLQPRVYTSTAIGMVVTTGEDDLSSALAGDNLALSKAISYESLANSRSVAEEVIADLQLDATPEELLGDIETFVPAETTEVRIIADAESPQEAADLANAWLDALVERVQQLEGNEASEAVGQVGLRPLSSASPPQYASSPNPKLNLAIGILIGLGLGMFYAVVRFKMDHRIHSVEQVRNDFGLPVLGAIPLDDRLAGRDVLLDVGPFRGNGGNALAESLNKLRTNLGFVSVDHPPRTIVVTSPLPGEGKSSITANLAVAIASTGRNVVVVDGDLRKPSIAEIFGVASSPGFSDVLTGRKRVDEVLQTNDKFSNLQILGAGQEVDNPSELLSPEAVRRFLDTLAEDALVLVDTPPLLPVADAALLTAGADGAIVVANAQSTTTDVLGQALDTLDQIYGTILGVVLNQVPTTGPHAMAFGYYGNYSSQGTSSSARRTSREAS